MQFIGGLLSNRLYLNSSQGILLHVAVIKMFASHLSSIAHLCLEACFAPI
ncbi:hypothetical protein HMPREF1991_00838 [Hoylesella loescheii DSM 19665 = JCM 12249 = ATCC 15930]|uniref:Uncharacterized protein n=1 Tax=Hoylesella loescheii DSM 19665 = JCM 12249 = ATCC 15930 TaxID=1122985 RepID=A0A069QK49_HOYLO|nr:hypothetical protein HMPREF1991_00838 [Hoylesella loescheii DSM 19665 = JCM 12249 = ATCC 15930]